jgi:hypothetical protein
VCFGCTEEQEWQRVQDGYGTLEQEPICSGCGKVTWHLRQAIPAWFPESIGKQAPWPLKLAGDQRQKPWQPRQASCGYPGKVV